MERGVYFDAWFPRQHCYHPSLPPRRLRMVEDLRDYQATVLVWPALGGGSISLAAALEWSVALGCVVSLAVIGVRAQRQRRPEELPVTIRGPLSYAGPGSLGGT